MRGRKKERGEGEGRKNTPARYHCSFGKLLTQPRSQGSLLPALRSERERETLENAGQVAPEQN